MFHEWQLRAKKQNMFSEMTSFYFTAKNKFQLHYYNSAERFSAAKLSKSMRCNPSHDCFLFFKSFPIHYSLITLSFDAI
jgi:hypothetical protein